MQQAKPILLCECSGFDESLEHTNTNIVNFLISKVAKLSSKVVTNSDTEKKFEKDKFSLTNDNATQIIKLKTDPALFDYSSCSDSENEEFNKKTPLASGEPSRKLRSRKLQSLMPSSKNKNFKTLDKNSWKCCAHENCNRRFLEEYQLQNHIRSKHEGIR